MNISVKISVGLLSRMIGCVTGIGPPSAVISIVEDVSAERIGSFGTLYSFYEVWRLGVSLHCILRINVRELISVLMQTGNLQLDWLCHVAPKITLRLALSLVILT